MKKIDIKKIAYEHPLWIALFFALSGGSLLYKHLANYKSSLGLGMSLRNVLVAKHSLLPGRVLQEDDFYQQPVPEKNIPLASLLDSDLDKIVGKKATRPIVQDEIVQWPSINPTNSGAGYLSSSIPQGYRAISITVSAETSVGSQIQIGDRVDILVQLAKKTGEAASTVTLLQNVSVLDVGEASTEDKTKGYSLVSLLVLPQEASLISHAKQFGSLQFTLRNPEDHDAEPTNTVLDQSLFAQQAFRQSLQKERNRIEIIRRGKPSIPE